MQQQQFQRFARHLAGLQEVARAESLLFPALEYRHNQRAGLHLLQWLPFERSLHV